MSEVRNKQLIVVVTPTEKEAIRKAFGSYAAMRDYVVDVAQMMLEGKKMMTKKTKKESLGLGQASSLGCKAGRVIVLLSLLRKSANHRRLT